jgi:hypothetical protein
MTLLIEYLDSSHICNTSTDMLQRKIQQSLNHTLAWEDKSRGPCRGGELCGIEALGMGEQIGDGFAWEARAARRWHRLVGREELRWHHGLGSGAKLIDGGLRVAAADSLASGKGVESVRNLVGVARPGSSSAPERGLRFISVKLTELKFRLQPKFTQSPMQSSCLSLFLLP